MRKFMFTSSQGIHQYVVQNTQAARLSCDKCIKVWAVPSVKSVFIILLVVKGADGSVFLPQARWLVLIQEACSFGPLSGDRQPKPESSLWQAELCAEKFF